MEHTVLVITFLSVVFVGTRCDCTSGDADDYVVIDPANYDRNYSSITSIGKRPYGFEKTTWYYNNPSRDVPCVKVTGASNRRVEVMVEAIPQSRLCVKDQNRDLGCADSGTGRLYSCKRARTNTVIFEFYCDKQCGEHDVQFWYRIVLGQTPDQDPEDHWCDDRSHEEYPENLLQLPLDYTFPSEITTQPSHAQSSSVDFVMHFIFIMMLCFITITLTHNL